MGAVTVPQLSFSSSVRRKPEQGWLSVCGPAGEAGRLGSSGPWVMGRLLQWRETVSGPSEAAG